MRTRSSSHGRSTCPRASRPIESSIIPPSIDPFSPKNRALDPLDVGRIVRRVGLYPGDVEGPAAKYVRDDGTDGVVERQASIVGNGPVDPELPLVVQVSRWDRLKDMQGVMTGFAEGVVGRVAANLALVGPTVAGVSDDPEGAAVLQECIRRLAPAAARGTGMHPARVVADGRHRGERVDGQRAPAHEHRRCAEEPRGGVRPYGRRSDVEGEASRRVTGRRHRRPDRTGNGRAAGRSA